MQETIFFSVALLAGVAWLVASLINYRDARDSEQWPEHEAEVLHSRVEKGRRSHYSPVVRYRYAHLGVSHEGTRLWFSSFSLTSRERVEQFLAPLSRGARITVRVNPRDPRCSVVVPGVNRAVKRDVFIGAYLILIGVGGLLRWWR